jgi:hypothetical protein
MRCFFTNVGGLPEDWLANPDPVLILRRMFLFNEADAAAIRMLFNQQGELSAAIELRRRLPGIAVNAKSGCDNRRLEAALGPSFVAISQTFVCSEHEAYPAAHGGFPHRSDSRSHRSGPGVPSRPSHQPGFCSYV